MSNGGTGPTPPPPALGDLAQVDPVTIPLSLIEQWTKLRLDHYLEVRLGRNDLDHFYNAFERSLAAHYELQECLVQYSNGNTALANEHIVKSRRLLLESQNSFRQAFMAIIVSAVTPSTLR